MIHSDDENKYIIENHLSGKEPKQGYISIPEATNGGTS